jgi:uncharacterized protein
MESAKFTPVPPGERLAHIDAIRGLALFGVLVMNAQYHFRGPYELYVVSPHPIEGFWNAVVDDALRFLVEGKAMTLFSILFGVGLALQLERKVAAGGGFWGFALRRMGALSLLGALHVVLLWYGDILIFYAAAGVLLLPFLRRTTKTVALWLASLYGLATVSVLVFATLRVWDTTDVQAKRVKAVAQAAARARELLAGYLQPGWWDVLVVRVGHYVHDYPEFWPALVMAFLNLLLGLALWRSGILRDPSASVARLRRLAPWLLALGFAAGLLHLFARPIFDIVLAHGGRAKALVYPLALSQAYGFQLMALAYGALVLLGWPHPAWNRVLRAFAPVGRMALTNYLMQSLVMTAIYNGWGLGLYGKVGPAANLVLCALFFSAQVLFSRWWLGRFCFGPVEWLWRCASYARRQPFKLSRADAPHPAGP